MLKYFAMLNKFKKKATINFYGFRKFIIKNAVENNLY